jgi:hypothetical protein
MSLTGLRHLHAAQLRAARHLRFAESPEQPVDAVRCECLAFHSVLSLRCSADAARKRVVLKTQHRVGARTVPCRDSISRAPFQRLEAEVLASRSVSPPQVRHPAPPLSLWNCAEKVERFEMARQHCRPLPPARSLASRSQAARCESSLCGSQPRSAEQPRDVRPVRRVPHCAWELNCGRPQSAHHQVAFSKQERWSSPPVIHAQVFLEEQP